MSQPSLNYHFRTKQELWEAAVDGLFADFRQVMESRLDGLRGVDTRTSAELSVREFIEFSARRPQLHRIIMQESKSDSERMDWLVDRHVRPLYDRVVAMFEQLSSDGVVPRHSCTTCLPERPRRSSCWPPNANGSPDSTPVRRRPSRPMRTRSSACCLDSPVPHSSRGWRRS